MDKGATGSNVIDVSLFCSPGDIRTILQKPFELDGRTVASNGHIAISVPFIEGTEFLPDYSTDLVASFRRILSSAENATGFGPIPLYDQPDEDDKACPICMGKKVVYACRECGGEGEVEAETDFNDSEVECKSCDGDGVVDEHHKAATSTPRPCDRCNGTGLNRTTPIKIGPTVISYAYLSLLVDLPGIEIDISGDHSDKTTIPPIPFRFDGGFGVVMPMRY
jgi:hypothetical protein